MHPFFICSKILIELRLKNLIKTAVSDDGCTDYYTDNNTNESWLLTRYESEYHEEGINVLQRLPEPSMKELIDIATTSTDTNNIIGASFELWKREHSRHEDFRGALVKKLLEIDMSKLTSFDKQRLAIIIDECELRDATNRRVVLGKHFTEIQNDADYYRRIAEKVRNMFAGIG